MNSMIKRILPEEDEEFAKRNIILKSNVTEDLDNIVDTIVDKIIENKDNWRDRPAKIEIFTNGKWQRE